jgi:hypothetical protein
VWFKYRTALQKRLNSQFSAQPSRSKAESLTRSEGVEAKLLEECLAKRDHSLFTFSQLLWMPNRDQVERGLVGRQGQGVADLVLVKSADGHCAQV